MAVGSTVTHAESSPAARAGAAAVADLRDPGPALTGQLPYRSGPGDGAVHVAAQRAAGHNHPPAHNPSGVAAPMSQDLGRRTVAGLAGIPGAEPWDGTTAQFDAFTVDRAPAPTAPHGPMPNTAISTLHAAMAAGRSAAQADLF